MSHLQKKILFYFFFSLLVVQKPSGFMCSIISGKGALMLCERTVGGSGSVFRLLRCLVLMAALSEKEPRLRRGAVPGGNASLALFLNWVTHFSILSTASAEDSLKFGWYISILPDANQMFL